MTAAVSGGEPNAEAAGEQVLYASKCTRILRRASAAGSVIVKQAMGSEAVARLRHEAAMLQRLAGVEGVPHIAPGAAATDSLLLCDDGGVPLPQVLQSGRLGLDEKLTLALELSRAVAAVHRHGVVHRDINPANILLLADLRPVLIDFNIAGVFADDHPVFTHQSDIAGTLSYMAPEQTGRTGRAVDQRADLYSLGVVFYELATGRRPFESEDLLELIHDHLVRVPVAPLELNPQLPPALPDIVMRLLEKDAERRYQSAEGLAEDLARLRQALARGDRARFPLGEHDFPLRLAPPTQLVGRGGDVKVLRNALDQAASGRCRALFVTGGAGVGKGALIDELRPLVTERRGWFVSGKFDRYSKDAPSATVQAFRALGRLLLAEPETELARHRARLLAALGPNVGIGPASLQEFMLLLGTGEKQVVSDPVEAEARLLQACVDMLRCIASPERPLVMVLDDLQETAEITVRFVNAVLTSGKPLPGFLLVGAYRDAEVGEGHPLAARLEQWEKLGVAPARLPLSNLAPDDLCVLVGKMLRLEPEQAAPLSAVLAARTERNPNDTIELINALRLDGLLARGEGGWRWDAAAIERYVGKCEVVDLLGRRIERLSMAARALLELMACISGDVRLGLLAVAGGLAPAEIEARLGAALDDGLLLMEQSHEITLRFRHDRVQQAVLDRLEPAARRRHHLAIARRLARQPEFALIAAEQYLAATEALDASVDGEERRHMVDLFRAAAGEKRVANNLAAERFLAAAIDLLGGLGDAADAVALFDLRVERHAALCGLARYDEADALYRSIAQDCADPLRLADAACVQLSSLCNRNRMREAVDLGLQMLAQFGVAPPAELQPAIGAGLARLGRWIAGTDKADDAGRAELDDPRVLALCRLVKKTQTPAFFCDPTLHAWLTLESHRLWVEHGPCATLLSCLGLAPMLLIAVLKNYRAAYAVARHLLAVGEARGYEPATSMARFIYMISSKHWFEPAEDSVREAHRAREVLLKAGEVQYTSYTYHVAIFALLNCAPTLDATMGEIDAGLAFEARSGDQHNTAVTLAFRQFVRAMRGVTREPGGFGDDGFDEGVYEACVDAMQSGVTVSYHTMRALSAALFGDEAGLVRHAAVAMPLLARAPGFYTSAIAQVLQALALAVRVRGAAEGERAALLAELDARREWLAQRAADAPMNFLHLRHLLDAERAWAVADAWTAAAAFDQALRELEGRSRPWQHGLIAERAGLFHLAQGMQHTGQALLAEACTAFQRWGATAKVLDLLRRHPFLRAEAAAQSGGEGGTLRSTIMSSQAVDMLAVLRASQALSSETSVAGINARVGELLGAMTGATSVLLAVKRDDPQGWFLSASMDQAEPVSVEEAAARGLLPLSAFRYAERTREQLVVADATHDDRFSRDPYLAGVAQCSLLILPVHSKGELRAVLLLENRQSRGAFCGDGLDTVALIAGQLSVSLDNALLYASLERKVAERTAALEAANRQLEQLSITDALTGLPNRRRFNEALEAEWCRAKRAGEPVGLALIDIDHFKLYNDHYGHQGGDACLKLVAEAMKGALRAGPDVVARYGGEEFVLVLPGTALAGTAIVAERLRAAVAQLSQPHAQSGHGIVTVSIGIASCVPSVDTPPERLVELADAALYTAKREGRNRVVSQP
ncbi:MAG: diguanylate cyclase [Nevskia sp.]|nr:diguanylate cyclase [Nevskia sp.]